MKKLLLALLILFSINQANAQKEGRLGLFSGGYASFLMNANDFEWGDMLPTYKMCGGIEGSYYITVGQKVGVGLSGQVGYWNNGQNYRGAYNDGSSYEAYSRLKYIKAGLALNVSTNLRRRVAARVFGGFNIGVLDTYQERFEHFRKGDSKLIMDITDQDVYYRDKINLNEYGKLSDPIYEPLALSVNTGLMIDIKISDDFILGVGGRFDMGMGTIETEADRNDPKKITFSGEEARVVDYPAFPTAIKFHGPTRKEIVRQPTTNQTAGVFISFTYRMYNRDRTDIWYVR